MIPPPLPPDEPDRLADLRALGILDTPAEERFDRLTRLAQDLFGVPIALVSLIDEDRQWFKSRQGLDAAETPREVSFCGHAILGDEVFVVPDATDDPRFQDNPLVTGDPDIRFYAGAPLHTPSGHRVGTLCVIDSEPRPWTEAQGRALQDLAAVVELELQQIRAQHQERALLALSAVTALTNEDRRELLRSALRLGCEYLGMPTGIVSHIDGEDFEVVVHVADAPGLQDGDHFPLGQTTCQLTLAADDVLAIADFSHSQHADHPCVTAFGIQAYVGMTIVVDDAPWGTVNFTSPQPRATPFTEAERDFLRMLGRWVASVVQRELLDDELERQQALSRAIMRAQSIFIAPETRSEAFEVMLADLLEVTGCEYGFIGEVLHDDNDLPYLKTRALSNIAWNEATNRLYEENHEAGLEFRNLNTLFGVTLRTAEPVLTNDPYHDGRRGGLPTDHPPMTSYLGLPVVRGGELVGMIGLANMPGGFHQEHVDFLQPLLAAIGQLIEASSLREQIAEDRTSIARLSQVASQSPAGILITDASGAVEWANEGFELITGFAREELLGRRPRDILHAPGASADEEKAALDAVRTGEGFESELAAMRKDGGTIWVSLQASQLFDADGRPEGYLVMVSDITERKNVDRMKSQFISTVSHELRTPLTAITGALGLVAGGVTGELAPRTQSMIDIAYTNSERLTTLINDLLDMERLVEGGFPLEMEDQLLMPIIERAIADNATYAMKFDVRLALTSRMDDAVVHVDSLRLIQILSNLLSNACKFSPAGGQVEVAVTASPDADPGDRVRVLVTDHGSGVPAAFRDQIFEKFSQADASDSRDRGGTGLGLAISKELTERMGGSIGFVSAEGAGATFFIDLPVVRASE